MTELVSDMQMARGEAIKRNAWMLVCARDVATDTCATGTNWSNGWLVCYDVNNDGACDTGTTANPNPVRVRRALDAMTLTGPNAVVRFNPSGTQGGSGATTVTFTMTGTWTGSSSRTGTVAPTGFIKSVKS
jgi:type IV fimbrial biogenesis protein FimT